ncbi:hypothetical protein [Lentibacillus sp. CBA3610]|uniref:hypothetical protein n=1 Tax=Lentibacillus sp. CBA3610 TaxID=2518176 RepID=UPI001595648F|nr:hypothetical protein [Lentibacillus sp. CBA3610]
MNIVVSYRIEWISSKNINVRHNYLPTRRTAARNYSVYLKRMGPLMDVCKYEDGQYLLLKGLDAFNILSVIDPHKKVPVFMTEKSMTELEWTAELLNSCVTEKVYFKFKYEYVMLLLEETGQDTAKIRKLTGWAENDIEKYRIDKDVPQKYKKLAYEHNRQNLVNDICRV